MSDKDSIKIGPKHAIFMQMEANAVNYGGLLKDIHFYKSAGEMEDNTL